MIQVKSFSDIQEDKDCNPVNEWLKEMDGKIKIIDIKYGVSCYPSDEQKGWDAQYTSGMLIIYETIEKENNSYKNKCDIEDAEDKIIKGY